MAVGLQAIEGLPAIPGVELAFGYSGIRKKTADDTLIMRWSEGASVAATFTRNAFCAAPVHVSRAHLGKRPRALVVNAGNANAGTGDRGMRDAQSSCDVLASSVGIDADQVLTFSTGVIFEPLPIDKLSQGIRALAPKLAEQSWDGAAKAIMTTDTLPKGVSAQVEIDGKLITLNGIVKGAGMIRPNMATMLAFMATDAAVDQAALQRLLSHSVDQSFNVITVDSDTSTNDSCVLIATGNAGNSLLDESHAQWSVFANTVEALALSLAQALVRDGEGATKFIEICVEGALSVDEARIVGFEVAHSPLVKTAIFAEDPNLGRLLMAIGKAPIKALDVSKVNLWLGDLAVVLNGEPHPDYAEATASQIMQAEDLLIRIDLGRGESDASVWTCDLSHDYVSINADYRS
ncbi:MAG: bifunctional glutamate N-acetyltransferase/amino-acid acetyltransferase ArgJ [Gammaproteobacteria bacterium]|nr:bifunctional glutamate N-acetyltransferase/amino-acid acetyltransferase ArgJ [Gammaproteobacteria bacterium]